jgi:hypothetical protein
MDLKEEVRRRIAELMRFAYERGYRDGAQSALTEIESLAGEDLVRQLSESGVKLGAIARLRVTDAPAAKPVRKARKPRAPQQAKPQRGGGRTKSAIVRAALQSILASRGEARRDELLSAARAEDPTITSQDVSNGLRALTKRAEIRLDPQDSARLLPAAEAATAS